MLRQTCGSIVVATVLAAGCTPTSEAQTGQQDIASSEQTLFACDEIVRSDEPGVPWAFQWIPEQKAIRWADRNGTSYVFGLKKIRFYVNNDEANAGGGPFWTLHLDLQDPDYPGAEDVDLRFDFSLVGDVPSIQVHYSDHFNHRFATYPMWTCRGGHAIGYSAITSFLSANTALADADAKAIDLEANAFEWGKIWDCWQRPGLTRSDRLLGFLRTSLFFPADPDAPGVVEDDRTRLHSASVVNGAFTSDAAGTSAFKFVSVLSDRRYFGDLQVSGSGASRRSTFSLYEGPVSGGAADSELAAHPGENAKRIACETSDFEFHPQMAKSFLARIGK